MAGKRYMVTGGAGFIGSHLCEALLAQGDSVVCVDNFFTGNRAWAERQRGNPDFALIEHDVVDPLEITIDAIYNLACPASPVHYQIDPIKTLLTSVLGALNLLELARAQQIPILQASTSEVYGDPHVHPQEEGYWGHVNPIGPRSCYDEGKRAAETLFSDYRRQHGVNTKIARIFNTYGPNMNPEDGRVVSNFIVQALRGEDITIYGDGRQTRSFCFVSDLVRGLVALMEAPPGVSGPVNLGNPAEMTVMELGETVIALAGSSSRITRRPLPVDDPQQRRPDIARAAELLGWRPEVPLDAGLAKTIDYFRERLSDPSPMTSP
jgi:UDP-glucuronate decarboxylase